MRLVEERTRVAVAGHDHRLRGEQQRSWETFPIAVVAAELHGLSGNRERIIGSCHQQRGCCVQATGDLPAFLLGQLLRRDDHLMPENREFEVVELATEVEAVVLQQDIARRGDHGERIGLSPALIERRCRERGPVFALGTPVCCLDELGHDRRALDCVGPLDEELEAPVDRLLAEFGQPDDFVVHERDAIDSGVRIVGPQRERLVEQADAILAGRGGIARLPNQTDERLGIDIGSRVEHVAVTDPHDDVTTERRSKSGERHPQCPVGARVVRPDIEQRVSPHRHPTGERQSKHEQQLAPTERDDLAVDANPRSAQHRHLDRPHASKR